MGVSNSNSSSLALVLVLVACASEKSLAVDARPISLFSDQGYSKVFGSLGIACECCDGVEGECRSSWSGSCSSLKCLPWKQHNLKQINLSRSLFYLASFALVLIFFCSKPL